MIAEVKNGKVKLVGTPPKDGEYEVKLVKISRTQQQNKAIHKWCQLMSDELNEKHIDKREFFKESFFTSWTPIAVKEDVWRPMQRALTKKESTTELDKIGEIDLICDNINRYLTERYNGEITVPEFPSYTNEF